jgi:hypothetical protein
MPEPPSSEPLQYVCNDNEKSGNLEAQPTFDFMDLFGNGHADMFPSELTLSFDSALYESQYLPWE